MAALDQTEPVQGPMSLDALRALQLARLRETVRHAHERVPAYRAKLEAAGAHPDDIRTLDDLDRLPFTTKDDLRAAYPYGLFAVPLEQVARLHASSGTTGKPTVVGYTKADLDVWAELLARSLRAVGVRTGDRIQNAFGYGLFTGGLGWHAGAERLGATVIPVSGGFTERQAQLIADLKPDVLMATPSYMLAIADECLRQGIDPATSSLRLGVFGAEPSSEGLRADIERRLGIDAYDSYGLSEVIGPGVAQERAGEKGRLTIWEDHFLPEIIDPATGEVVADGEPGELVLTALTKQALPVIRYRTRDLTRLLPGTQGPMRAMERLTGRSDDMLIIRGVNVFPSQIETVLVQEERLSAHYVLEVRRERRLDALDVVVEAREAAGDDDLGTLARHAEHLIKAYVGVSARVRVVAPGTIERSQGKAKRVIDLRPKD